MKDEASAVLAENKQLRNQNRALRQELSALYASRWWRFRPRALVRRQHRAGESIGSSVVGPDVSPPPSVDDGTVRSRFTTEVLPLLTVTRDSFTDRIVDLEPIASLLDRSPARILEIGSYEGMSACYFLWRLSEAELTCIDTFTGGLADRAASMHASLEQTFDHNIAVLDTGRVTKIVADSRAALVDLQGQGARFDLIYVDGSHLGLDVLVDAALSWRLLGDGGFLVFDDYRWNDAGDDPLLRPGPAIDAVLALLEGKHDVLHKGAQVAIRKRTEAP